MENELGIVVNATPEQVWRVLADPPRMPQWLTREGPFPHVLTVDGVPGPSRAWYAESMDGQTAMFTVTTWDEPQQLAYEMTTAPAAPLKMEQAHKFDVDIDEGGTLLTWLVTWQVYEDSWLAGWLQERQLAADITTMQMYSLKRLKEIVEIEVTGDDNNDINDNDDDTPPQDGD